MLLVVVIYSQDLGAGASFDQPKKDAFAENETPKLIGAKYFNSFCCGFFVILRCRPLQAIVIVSSKYQSLGLVKARCPFSSAFATRATDDKMSAHTCSWQLC